MSVIVGGENALAIELLCFYCPNILSMWYSCLFFHPITMESQVAVGGHTIQHRFYNVYADLACIHVQSVQ